PFDAAKLRILGPAVPVVEDVAWTATDGIAGYAVSSNGTLVYLKASEWNEDRRVAWVDRSGNERPALPEMGQWAEPRLSPDGRWLAFEEVGTDNKPQVYVRLLSGGGRRQVSADGGSQPRWTRGGREIVFRKGAAVYAASFQPTTGDVGTPALLFRKADA